MFIYKNLVEQTHYNNTNGLQHKLMEKTTEEVSKIQNIVDWLKHLVSTDLTSRDSDQALV